MKKDEPRKYTRPRTTARRFTHAVTVYMTKEMAKMLTGVAKNQGITIAQVVRNCVTDQLEAPNA